MQTSQSRGVQEIRVLIVDDDLVDIKHIKNEFSKFNPTLFTFTTVEDGEDALDLLYGRNGHPKLNPQIIIADINMPRMNGNDFVKKLRDDSHFDNLPIFIVTCAYTKADKIATEGLRIPHMVKPLTRDDISHMYMHTLKTIKI